MPELIIRRGRAYADAVRAYKIFVDGEARGEIRQGGEVSLDVPPGQHVVQLRVDWCTSSEVTVRAGEAPVVLACRPKSSWHAFNAFFDPSHYIRLEQIDG